MKKEDSKRLVKLINIIWPTEDLDELEESIQGYIDNPNSKVYTVEEDGEYIAVVVCALRNDYVEGCEHYPVAYLEGIVVDEKYRNTGIARKLVEKCEQWGRSMGCKEFASDCELDNTDSLNFHKSIGFEEVNRTISFKKKL